MPDRARVSDFVATVVAGRHVEAIERFYAPHATMQENCDEPRRGREALIEHERAMTAHIVSMRTHRPKTLLVDGDRVAINWIFDVVTSAGDRRRLEEMAVQLWDNDLIIEERFFYDTAKAWHLID